MNPLVFVALVGLGCATFTLSLFGWLMVGGGLRSRRLARKLGGATTTAATTVDPHRLVTIRGRVEPIAPVISAPLSGRRAVAVRILVEVWRGRGKYGKYVVAHRESAGTFAVDDGSGLVVRVDESEMMLFAPKRLVVVRSSPMAPPLRAWLVSRGLQPDEELGRGGIRLTERMVAPGETVEVTGRGLRSQPGLPTSEGHRVVPSTELALGVAPSSMDERLVVSTRPRDVLVRDLRRPFLIGVGLATAGLVSLAPTLVLGRIFFAAALHSAH